MIGATVKDIRKKLGLTQVELEEILKCARKRVSWWETKGRCKLLSLYYDRKMDLLYVEWIKRDEDDKARCDRSQEHADCNDRV